MTPPGAAPSSVEKLAASHSIDAFACGKEPLDRFLKRFAAANQKAGRPQTYVVCRDDRQVVGYYSLCVGAVEPAEPLIVSARVSPGTRYR